MELDALDKGRLIAKLKSDLLQWQGFKPAPAAAVRSLGIPAIESAFPQGVFPRAAIHEFLGTEQKLATASRAFIAALLSQLNPETGVCLYISTSRSLFPPALASFGMEPDKMIFIDVQKEKDALWAIEEALKCEGLTAVIGELREITFAQSRRFQLIVEKSKVSCFILRTEARKLSSTTCIARWRISPLPSYWDNDMPGPGHPRWNVELLKVKNGKPGSWKLEWSQGQFRPLEEKLIIPLEERRKFG